MVSKRRGRCPSPAARPEKARTPLRTTAAALKGSASRLLPRLLSTALGPPLLQFLHSKGLRACGGRPSHLYEIAQAVDCPVFGIAGAYVDGAPTGDVYAMASTPPVIRQEEDVWVLRIELPSGSVQEYRCLSELQAKQLAAMLLTPREQPSP